MVTRRTAVMARRMMARMTDRELGDLVAAGRAVQARLEAAGQLAILDEDLSVLDDARQARDTLVARHHRLVVHLARQWAGPSVEVDDLIQAGLIGLTRAVELWDPTRGVPLGAWARVRIRQAISRAADQARGTTESGRARTRAVREAAAALADRLGRAPTEVEVAAELGWPVERVHATTRPVVASLDAPPPAEGAGILLDRLAATENTEEEVERGVDAAVVRRMLDLLPAGERELLRHGVEGGEAAAARRVGISPGAARTAVARARARLMHPRYRARWARAAA